MGPLSFATTSDGSKTLFNSEVGEHYHSRHGALQESQHVFLDSGLNYYLRNGEQDVSVLEVGFGTGLNFLVSADLCRTRKISLKYTGIEAYPLTLEQIIQTDYHQYVEQEIWSAFIEKYNLAMNQFCELDSYIRFQIVVSKLIDFKSAEQYDVLYFDAFAAIHQPEMWTEDALAHITSFLRPGGVFVTYAITGNLKRTMKALGFSIEKAPGAPGKREMLRAVKF